MTNPNLTVKVQFSIDTYTQGIEDALQTLLTHLEEDTQHVRPEEVAGIEFVKDGLKEALKSLKTESSQDLHVL